MSEYKKGELVKGQVSGIEKYGIFINIDQYYNGLIHISEISDDFIRDVNDYVNIGETVFAKILEVDEENGQLKLSLKGLDFKIKRKFPKVKETESGFKPLADKLDEWIETTKSEIEQKNKQ